MKKLLKQKIDSLETGLPKWVIILSGVLMVLSAIAAINTSGVYDWVSGNVPPVLMGIVNTAGMVIIYFGYMKGMKGLQRPLTVLWWIAIGLNLAGFATTCLGPDYLGYSAAVAAFLPLVYLPLGVLLWIWYAGKLEQAGIWMIVRILIMTLVPVVFYLLGWDRGSAGIFIEDILTVAAELIYVWALLRVVWNF